MCVYDSGTTPEVPEGFRIRSRKRFESQIVRGSKLGTNVIGCVKVGGRDDQSTKQRVGPYVKDDGGPVESRAPYDWRGTHINCRGAPTSRWSTTIKYSIALRFFPRNDPLGLRQLLLLVPQELQER